MLIYFFTWCKGTTFNRKQMQIMKIFLGKTRIFLEKHLFFIYKVCYVGVFPYLCRTKYRIDTIIDEK